MQSLNGSHGMAGNAKHEPQLADKLSQKKYFEKAIDGLINSSRQHFSDINTRLMI
jgi:hypothetical protein